MGTWYKKARNMNYTQEMLDHYEKRTKMHIALVSKYCSKIAAYNPEFKELLERAKVHDQSKFENPEREPYIWVTWKYKLRADGKELDVPQEILDRMHEATYHHVTSNSHHPEYHAKDKTNLINKENRDAPPDKIVDATSMPLLDVAEMVADWSAVSEEKGNTPREWADKNVNVRWKFTDEQKNLIYDLIDGVWEVFKYE